MSLWIICKKGIGFSKLIAEMLQDRLVDYIDVSVGSAKKIDPSFLVDEKFDYLIIGDVISNEIPSMEIQNWLRKYKEISNKYKLNVKLLSGFYIAPSDIKTKLNWVEFLQDNVKSEIIYPSILCLKLNSAELALENGALDLVKGYSNNFLDFFLRNK